MTNAKQTLLRFNAAFLIVAASGGLLADIAGSIFRNGPQAILSVMPQASIGFMEAHGLALIIGILMWRAAPTRSWHFTAAAVHTLLATCNVLFWQAFVLSDNLVTGYITTSFHALFVMLQLWAATMLSTKGNRFGAYHLNRPPYRYLSSEIYHDAY